MITFGKFIFYNSWKFLGTEDDIFVILLGFSIFTDFNYNKICGYRYNIDILGFRFGIYLNKTFGSSKL
jgi:hypothetical protein